MKLVNNLFNALKISINNICNFFKAKKNLSNISNLLISILICFTYLFAVGALLIKFFQNGISHKFDFSIISLYFNPVLLAVLLAIIVIIVLMLLFNNIKSQRKERVIALLWMISFILNILFVMCFSKKYIFLLLIFLALYKVSKALVVAIILINVVVFIATSILLIKGTILNSLDIFKDLVKTFVFSLILTPLVILIIYNFTSLLSLSFSIILLLIIMLPVIFIIRGFESFSGFGTYISIDTSKPIEKKEKKNKNENKPIVKEFGNNVVFYRTYNMRGGRVIMWDNGGWGNGVVCDETDFDNGKVIIKRKNGEIVKNIIFKEK